jgi:hypothetical protein
MPTRYRYLSLERSIIAFRGSYHATFKHPIRTTADRHSMPAVDPYAVLGLWPGASQEQIKRAYRRAVKRCHPDLNKSPKAKENFLKIQMAYEMLCGNPFYAESEVIHGDGWSASRESTFVDFSPKSGSAYKVKVAREIHSVQSPFYKTGERAIKYDGKRAIAIRQFVRTLWIGYMAIFAGASVGFVLEGVFFMGSGRVLEGAVAAGVGVTLIIVLMVILSVGLRSGLLTKL